MNTDQSASQSQLDGTSPNAATWAVWRQDDSGTQFLVEDHLTETQARSMAAEFEARGHKQTYWCRDEAIK